MRDSSTEDQVARIAAHHSSWITLTLSQSESSITSGPLAPVATPSLRRRLPSGPRAVLRRNRIETQEISVKASTVKGGERASTYQPLADKRHSEDEGRTSPGLRSVSGRAPPT